VFSSGAVCSDEGRDCYSVQPRTKAASVRTAEIRNLPAGAGHRERKTEIGVVRGVKFQFNSPQAFL